ncbi:MAG: hypothetical protein ACPL4H_08340 [Anaerolineales bacterium]
MQSNQEEKHPQKICQVKLYPISGWQWGIWIIFLILLNILLLSLFIFSYWYISVQSDATLAIANIIQIIAIYTLVLGVSILLTYINWKRSQQFLAIYDEGIYLKRSKPQKLPWNSIQNFNVILLEQYFLWFRVKKSWIFNLKLKNGKTIKLHLRSKIPEPIIIEALSAFQSSQQIVN